MTALLIIFAKEPRSGQVKTRLSPPLTSEEAAQLYHNFLLDVLDEMNQVPEVQLSLAFSPPEAQELFRNLASPGTILFHQEGSDLGDRMTRACFRGFQAGFSPVLLRGVDIPDLPAAVVNEARNVLVKGAAQVVLGPATDGGYYLVGLNKPQPRLFQGPVWSNSTVLKDTLEIARQQDLAVHLLTTWSDIDTPDDLVAFLHRGEPGPQPGWRSRSQAKELLKISDPDAEWQPQ